MASPAPRYPAFSAYARYPALAAAAAAIQQLRGGDVQEASRAGISQGVISQALGGVTIDQTVLNFDGASVALQQDFEQYSRPVGAGESTWTAMLARHAALLSSIEAKFGVPRQIVVAIWAGIRFRQGASARCR